MIYDLNDPRQYMDALDFIEHAKQNNIQISLEKKKYQRTSQQNRYYWLILRYFGLQYGCTKTEAAYYFKQVCNPDIFCKKHIDKEDRAIYIVRSTSELNKQEMISALNNFRVWCSQRQIELPKPEDKEMLRYAEQQVERNLSWT